MKAVILIMILFINAEGLFAQKPDMIIGDLNLDGIVDWQDLFIIIENWQFGSRYTPTPEEPLSTPTPTGTPRPVITQLPAPSNIRLDGQKVSSHENIFCESVHISWDPIPGFEIADSSSYYRLDFFYPYDPEYYEPAFTRIADETTCIQIGLYDSDVTDAQNINGVIFYVKGVFVTTGGLHFVGKESIMHWFRLIPCETPTPTPTPTAILTPTP